VHFKRRLVAHENLNRMMSMRRTGAAAAVMLAGLLGAAPAEAQWNVSSVGVVEYDTNETLLLLAGLTAGPSGPGIRPVFGVQGYYLTYDAGANRSVSITSIRPSAGLRGPIDGGSWNARVGYAFVSKDQAVPAGVFVPDASGGDGVVLSGGVDYWGNGGPLGWQALASYNIGTESFWGRGRVTTRLTPTVNGGVEAAVLTSPGFTAFQPGAVVNFHMASGTILGLGAGAKISADADNAAYVKAEIVLPIMRP
jgi:hypothetical protein